MGVSWRVPLGFVAESPTFINLVESFFVRNEFNLNIEVFIFSGGGRSGGHLDVGLLRSGDDLGGDFSCRFVID